jgi:NAD-dependent DNA ligase
MRKKLGAYSFPNPETRAGELIKRRRLQMLIHSCLYYSLNENIWDDITFDQRAKELANLIQEHPDAYSDRFDEYFEGWDGSSGFHLPHRDPWVLAAAQRLIEGN